MKEYMLTTIDNPFNPFDKFDEWRAFDDQKNYHTCEYLARVAVTSEEMTEEEEDFEIDRAMNEIVELNPFGLHIKVGREV